MRGMCGWFSERPVEAGAAALQAMLAASPSPTPESRQATTSQGAIATFGSAMRPTLLEDDGFVLAVLGHPRWRDGRGAADAASLARELKQRAGAALADLGGDFAIAAWDNRQRRGLIAVDRFGVQRLTYGRVGSTLAFASTLDLLGGYPGIERRLSTQGLYDYLFFHVSPGPRTVFEGLHRLSPGHCIEFDARGAGEPRPYWSMRYEERNGRALPELEAEFVSLLEGAVRDASSGEAAVGSFLSGGTDSSTVSGMLSRVGGGTPTRSFSIGFDAKGYDEMEYARVAARHYGCTHEAYYVTPGDVVQAVPKIAAAYDEPFGNASAVPTYYCARLAREHGVARLLAGDGGDELFGGNDRYAKQQILGLYQRVPEAMRAAVIEPLLMSTSGIRHVMPLRKLRSYVEQARPAMPRRYESYNLLMHLGLERVFTPDFLAAVDAERPHALMAEVHAPFADASLINQMMGIDLRLILADGDLPKVTRMTELAGVDVAFPLLDERIVEFSRTLPSGFKLRGTQLRWFFKHALRNFLPPQVIAKRKHGFGLPVGAWLTTHRPLYELAADSAGMLRTRGIVQPRFIDELFTRTLHEHPAYYGTMAWVLMVLGQWLHSRRL